MQPSTIEYYQQLARDLDEAQHGGKTAIIEKAASFLSISINTIYENLKKVGYESGRKVREDRGETHIDLDDARLICGMVYQARRANSKSILSVENAIEMAFASKQIKELYHPTTLLRVARMHGFHPEQLAKPTPHVSMQSKHPNHVWQVDASVGTLFYLKNGGVEFLDEKKHYKNKPQHLEAVKRHLCIRYAAVDHYSNAAFCKYYATSGENQEIFFDFIASAFLKRERDSFHGVPKIIVMDKGAANTSKLVLNFLDRMGIEHYAHMTGNSRAKGSAEKMQDIIERGFESRLRYLHTPVDNAYHLNQLVTGWMIAFNEQSKLNRNGIDKTRMELWNTIKTDELVIAPSMEVMQSILSSKPHTRKVTGELTVSFESRKYSVENVPFVKVGDTVTFSTNPYRYPNIDIHQTDYQGKLTLHECSPLEFTEAGFREDSPIIGETIESRIDTVTDIERKEIIKRSYGVETLEEANKLNDGKAQLYNGKIDPMKPIRDYHKERENITQIPKRGTQLEVDAPIQVLEKITIAEACKRLKAEMGEQYPKDAYAYLSKHYPDGIDPMQIDNIKRQLIARSTLRIVNQ